MLFGWNVSLEDIRSGDLSLNTIPVCAWAKQEQNDVVTETSHGNGEGVVPLKRTDAYI